MLSTFSRSFQGTLEERLNLLPVFLKKAVKPCVLSVPSLASSMILGSTFREACSISVRVSFCSRVQP